MGDFRGAESRSTLLRATTSPARGIGAGEVATSSEARSSWRRWRWFCRARPAACNIRDACVPGFSPDFQQRFRGEHQVVALFGRLVAQELVEIALVDLVAIELRAFARRIDLDVVDLAGIADRLRRAGFHDAPEADAGAEIRMLLDHGRGDVERGVGIPVRGLVGHHLDRRILVEHLHDAADLIDAGGGGEFTLHDLHLAGFAASRCRIA